jgi:hypothetical protein
MQIISLLFLMFGWWQSNPPVAQASLDEVCRVTRCREARVVQIELSNGAMSELRVPRGPIVDRDTVSLFVGETVVLALEPDGAGTFRVSAPIDEPPKGKKVVLELRQERPRPGEPKVTMLIVTSSLGQPIHFRAEIVLAANQGGRATSICPVRPSVPSFEMWEHPLPLLLLRNFVVAEPNMPCR